MENASKALLMAGGVLIGLLIIALAVYLFTSFGTTSAEVNRNIIKAIATSDTAQSIYRRYLGE